MGPRVSAGSVAGCCQGQGGRWGRGSLLSTSGREEPPGLSRCEAPEAGAPHRWREVGAWPLPLGPIL